MLEHCERYEDFLQKTKRILVQCLSVLVPGGTAVFHLPHTVRGAGGQHPWMVDLCAYAYGPIPPLRHNDHNQNYGLTETYPWVEILILTLTPRSRYTRVTCSQVPPPSHKYHDRKSGLTEICKHSICISGLTEICNRII
eukprot:COSAG01_NODE_143_length_24153_cov_54.226116_21_plen_139_part_00